MNMELGRRIKDRRKELDLTQRRLALLVGVSFQCVSKWEADESLPDIPSLIRLSDALNVSLDYLLRGKEFSQEDHAAEKEILLHYESHIKPDHLTKRDAKKLMLLTYGYPIEGVKRAIDEAFTLVRGKRLDEDAYAAIARALPPLLEGKNVPYRNRRIKWMVKRFVALHPSNDRKRIKRLRDSIEELYFAKLRIAERRDEEDDVPEILDEIESLRLATASSVVDAQLAIWAELTEAKKTVERLNKEMMERFIEEQRKQHKLQTDDE